MRKVAKVVVAAALVLTWVGSAWALEFSAQVLRVQGGLEATAQVNVKDGRLRLEPMEAAQPGAEGTYYIFRQDRGVSWLVYPQQKVYFEAPLQPGLDLSRPQQPGETLPGEMKRQDLGAEAVEGRPARKYEITLKYQEQIMMIWYWYAQDLKLPIKTAAPDGSWSVTYRQVKVAPQADKLFEPPAGFTKQPWPTQAAPDGR
jgi:hypothetical protein